MFQDAGQIAVGEQSVERRVGVDQHDGTRTSPRPADTYQHLPHRLRLIGHATFAQRTHDIFHFGQFVPETAAGMKPGKVGVVELAAATDDQRQRVAQGQHGGGTGAGSESQGTGLLERTQIQRHACGTSQRTLRIARDREPGNGHRRQAGNQPRHFRRLTAHGQRQDQIQMMNPPEIPVHRLTGMHEVSAGAGRGQRGRDLLSNQAGLAHAGHNHVPAACQYQVDRLTERVIQAIGQHRECLGLGADDLTSEPQLFETGQCVGSAGSIRAHRHAFLDVGGIAWRTPIERRL